MEQDEPTVHIEAPSAKAEVRVEAPVPPPKPKEPKMGQYVLQQGDTPGLVSIKLYGRSHRAVELARVNPDSDWEPGSTIKLV